MAVETKQSLLIVDDREFDRLLLSEFLADRGYVVLTATNGSSALRMIEKNRPELVLLDSEMPEMSGSLVLEKIRARFNAVEMPVIMVTGKTATDDIVSALKAGANDYITKPLAFEVAAIRIANHLQLSKLSREMARLKEVDAINAIITTYNHEINNALMVALNSLRKADGVSDAESTAKTEAALWNIAEIVKEIHEVTGKTEVPFEDYSSSRKMIKIKK